MVAKSSTGTSGGLALFQRNGVNVNVKSMSKYHIDVVIEEEGGGSWRFTGIYGESKSEEKENTWELLRLLKAKSILPWVYSGDFNEILFNCEKEGGAPRAEAYMEGFRKALAIVISMTWALAVIHLLGETTTIWLPVTPRRD